MPSGVRRWVVSAGWIFAGYVLAVVMFEVFRIVSLPVRGAELVLQMQLVIAALQLGTAGLVAWATVRYASLTSRSLDLLITQHEEARSERRLGAIAALVSASNHAITNAQAMALVQRRSLSLRHRFARGIDERLLGIRPFSA